MLKYKELLFLKELNGVGTVKINKFYLPLLQNGITLDNLKDVVIENESKVNEDNVSLALSKAEATYNDVINRNDLHVYTILDPEYPGKLKCLENKAPVIIYVKGNVALTEQDSVSIVGTRTPGDWSTKVEQQLVTKILDLTKSVIVSGLALGCDTIAHKTCLENNGLTIALLPCGFDHISPASNSVLSEEILKNKGVLISEYPPNTEATQYTFVERDVLIAAISDAVFVVECGKKSGTMHTANAAHDLKKPIGVFKTNAPHPGNYDGNEYIINEKNGFAVSDNKTLEEFLKLIKKNKSKDTSVQMSLFDYLGK